MHFLVLLCLKHKDSKIFLRTRYDLPLYFSCYIIYIFRTETLQIAANLLLGSGFVWQGYNRLGFRLEAASSNLVSVRTKSSRAYVAVMQSLTLAFYIHANVTRMLHVQQKLITKGKLMYRKC